MTLYKKFHSRFRGLERCYGTYSLEKTTTKAGKVKGKARTLRKPVTDALWKDHLTGKLGLGITPINDDGVCLFGAVDIDVYDGLDHQDIEKKILDLKLPLLVCTTKSGGAHLYLFLKEETPASLVRAKLMEWSTVLGYPGVEIFPKQIELAGEDDVGSWINIPYVGGNDSNRYGIRNGEKLSVKEFLEYADESEVGVDDLAGIKVEQDDNLEGAPPCLHHLCINGIPEGSRNNAMFSIAVYLKKKYPDDYEEKIRLFNQEYFDPPLSITEVDGIVKSMVKKDYMYKCNDVPLVTVCNKSICVTKEFGIGGEGEDPGVEFGGLVKINTDPPYWYLDVNGKRLKFETTDHLINQQLFRKICMETLTVLPNRVKQGVWDRILRGLLDQVEEVDAPEDASEEGLFWHLFDEFIYHLGTNEEELLSGKAFSQNGHIFLRSVDLIKHLKNQKYKDTQPKKIWSLLREKDAKDVRIRIKGKVVRLWKIPSEHFTEQTEDFTIPDVDQEPF